MKSSGSCKINSISVYVIVAVIIVTGSILSTVPTQETDAVTRQHSKKTVCVDDVCMNNETVIGDCQLSQCKSENSVTIK
jgi:uncharacterized phosphosugar-binding protein